MHICLLATHMHQSVETLACLSVIIIKMTLFNTMYENLVQ